MCERRGFRRENPHSSSLCSLEWGTRHPAPKCGARTWGTRHPPEKYLKLMKERRGRVGSPTLSAKNADKGGAPLYQIQTRL